MFDKDAIVRAVVEAGYRHLDCAMIYKNEELVGEALKEIFAAGIKREEIYITTKLWHSGYNDVEAACRESLTKLGLDYVDLYLIHWPVGFYTEPKMPLHKLWPNMEALIEKGLTKSIGLCNHNTQMIWDLLCYAKIKPVAV